MKNIAKNFHAHKGAGYYSYFQCGSHEETHTGVWFEGTEESLTNDDGELELPPFTYWEDDTPICESYCEDQMRKVIMEKLIHSHRNCGTDVYGQRSKSNDDIYSLFGEHTEEVLDYLKANPIIKISTYGGRYGTYLAMSEIVDEEIKKACREAFTMNENRKRNLNSW